MKGHRTIRLRIHRLAHRLSPLACSHSCCAFLAGTLPLIAPGVAAAIELLARPPDCSLSASAANVSLKKLTVLPDRGFLRQAAASVKR